MLKVTSWAFHLWNFFVLFGPFQNFQELLATFKYSLVLLVLIGNCLVLVNEAQSRFLEKCLVLSLCSDVSNYQNQTSRTVRDSLTVKNWWKMPKLKNSDVTFWVIFKHCVRKIISYLVSVNPTIENEIVAVAQFELKVVNPHAQI